MSGPIGALPNQRMTQQLNEMITSPSGFDALRKMMDPAVMPDPFRPADETLMAIARIARGMDGVKLVDWLRAITDLAPFPTDFRNMEEAAIAAAKHAGRASIGMVLVKAIVEGNRLLDEATKGPTP
jgi:hypothetical protein